MDGRSTVRKGEIHKDIDSLVKRFIFAHYNLILHLAYNIRPPDMKVSTVALLCAPIIAFTTLCLSVTLEAVDSPSSLGPHKSDCKRDVVEVANAVNGQLISKAELSWMMSGLFNSYSVCKIVNHHGDHKVPCTQYSILVAGIIFSIIGLLELGSSPTQGSTSTGRTIKTYLNGLEANGFIWDDIETPSI